MANVPASEESKCPRGSKNNIRHSTVHALCFAQLPAKHVGEVGGDVSFATWICIPRPATLYALRAVVSIKDEKMACRLITLPSCALCHQSVSNSELERSERDVCGCLYHL